MKQAPRVELIDIKKSFSGIPALKNVSLKAFAGECHGIVGENGAGKSTLMKVLSGVWPAGSFDGQILVEGRTQHFSGPMQAIHAGVRIIHQELALFDELSIAENLFMGQLPKDRGLLDKAGLIEKSEAILKQMKIELSPLTKVSELSVGQKQLIEIARAFTKEVKVLIFDEPSAALTDQEVEVLFELIQNLKKQGVACLYISHKLNEIRELCERATVIRDGEVIETLTNNEMSDERIVASMVGRKIDAFYPKKRPPQERHDVLLEVSNLSLRNPETKRPILKNISFEVHRGEILGIAGLVGSKRTELLMSLFGGLSAEKTSGEFRFNGEKTEINSPQDAIAHGIALVTEDRKQSGLFLERSIRENMTLPILRRISHFRKILFPQEEKLANKYMEAFRVKAPHLDFVVKFLSGGNQQKVILGRWLATEPKLLLLDEPTRGVDVGAKVEIYQILRELVDQGLTILMVSSELPEVTSLADRVLVMREGELAGELKGEDIDSESIMEKAVV